jgi:hypothetical protein
MKVTPVGSSAADFVFFESAVAPRFVMASTYWYDIRGGITAGQDGMILASAKNALWDALALYLVTRRAIYQTPTSRTALHSLLAETVDKGLLAETVDKGLLAEIDALLLGNPATYEEAVSFAEACLDFINDRLEMKRWRQRYGDLTSSEQLAAYHGRLLDLAKVGEELGFALPRPVEAVRERIEFRREIERRVEQASNSAGQ